MPAEIRRWNWGAFLMTWMWGIGNGVWVASLGLIPLIGLVIAVWLGISGNDMAWRARRWRDVEHFRSTQRAWAMVGVALLLLKAAAVAWLVAVAAGGVVGAWMH